MLFRSVYFRLDGREKHQLNNPPSKTGSVRVGHRAECTGVGLAIMMMIHLRSKCVRAPVAAVRDYPTVINSVSLTTMKSVPLALTFVGACAAWVTRGDLRAQTILGDTKTHVTGSESPVTWKLVQVKGSDREWSSPRGRRLLIKR